MPPQDPSMMRFCTCCQNGSDQNFTPTEKLDQTKEQYRLGYYSREACGEFDGSLPNSSSASSDHCVSHFSRVRLGDGSFLPWWWALVGGSDRKRVLERQDLFLRCAREHELVP